MRTRAAGILRGLTPWHTDFGTKSSMLHLAKGVHALSVRTYAAIAPSEPYRGATKFAQSELDPVKQKAGCHRDGGILPLFVYRSAYSRHREHLVKQKVPEPFFTKNRVRVQTVWWTVQDSNL